MKLILDDVLYDETKNQLLNQKDLKDLSITAHAFITTISFECPNDISPLAIMKQVNFLQQGPYPTILAFNKEFKGQTKTLKYLVKDMCCEYCYKSFVLDLLKYEYINSLKSNFDLDKPAFNIELEIEYINYSEDELIQIIKENLGEKEQN